MSFAPSSEDYPANISVIYTDECAEKTSLPFHNSQQQLLPVKANAGWSYLPFPHVCHNLKIRAFIDTLSVLILSLCVLFDTKLCLHEKE